MKTETTFIFVPDFCIMLKEISKYDGIPTSEIHHNTKITYSHLHYLRKVLEKKGWIKTTKQNVRILLFLTDEGKELVSAIDNFLDKLGIKDAELLNHRMRGKRETAKLKEVEKNVDNNKGVQLGHGTSIGEPQRPVQEHTRAHLQTIRDSEEEDRGSGQQEQLDEGDGSRLQGIEEDSEGENSRPF